MLHVLSEMGRSFIRAFIGSLVILAPGVLSAPNLNAAVLLGVAALIASLAAGLKALQLFVPQLSFVSLLPASVAKYGFILDSFVRAFLATFITGAVGILGNFDVSTAKAAVIALLVAAVTAGIRAIQGALTPGDVPAPASGVVTPHETNPATPTNTR